MGARVEMATVLFALATTTVEAAEFAESFDDGVIDEAELSLSVPDGFAIALVDGKAVFEKADGTGNGFARMTMTSTAKGDFDITVVAERTEPAGVLELGLVCSHLDVGGFTDIFYVSDNIINSNMLVGSVSQVLQTSNADAAATFRIRRVGEDLFHEFDAGSGFQQLGSATHPDLAGPVKCGLFLGQEAGQTVRNEGTSTTCPLSPTP